MNKSIWGVLLLACLLFMLLGIPFLLNAIEAAELSQSLVPPNGLFGWRILLCATFLGDAWLMLFLCHKLLK